MYIQCGDVIQAITGFEYYMDILMRVRTQSNGKTTEDGVKRRKVGE